MTSILNDITKCGSIFICALLAACSGGSVDAGKPSGGVAKSEPPAAVAGEPVHALVTVPVNAAMPADFGERMAATRQAPGALGVTVLTAQPGPEPAGFQSLAIVEFQDESSLQQWMQTLADTGAKVRQADVLAHDAGDAATSSFGTSYFAVNHYGVLVSPSEYKTYTEKYIVPNMAHQRSTGALLAYTMYLERSPPDELPVAVLVKQYGSPEEQARGEAAKEIYKTDVLMKQPEWKQINDTKTTIRNDMTETFARVAN